jgi:hypothetical protein
MAMEIRVRQGLRASRESMHGPAVGEQALSQGEAKALGSAGDESGGHWI